MPCPKVRRRDAQEQGMSARAVPTLVIRRRVVATVPVERASQQSYVARVKTELAVARVKDGAGSEDVAAVGLLSCWHDGEWPVVGRLDAATFPSGATTSATVRVSTESLCSRAI